MEVLPAKYGHVFGVFKAVWKSFSVFFSFELVKMDSNSEVVCKSFFFLWPSHWPWILIGPIIMVPFFRGSLVGFPLWQFDYILNVRGACLEKTLETDTVNILYTPRICAMLAPSVIFEIKLAGMSSCGPI